MAPQSEQEIPDQLSKETYGECGLYVLSTALMARNASHNRPALSDVEMVAAASPAHSFWSWTWGWVTLSLVDAGWGSNAMISNAEASAALPS
jgi:hypothetical protein